MTILLAAALAACGGDDTVTGPDGGELDATYTRLTWTCASGGLCGGRPPLTAATTLTISGHVIDFIGDDGVRIERHHADDEFRGCLIVPADPGLGLYARSAYQVCGGGIEASTEIGFRPASDPGQPFQMWRLTALR